MSDKELWTEEDERNLLGNPLRYVGSGFLSERGQHVRMFDERLVQKLLDAYFTLQQYADLSPKERSFLAKLADYNDDVDVIDIFADWLTDNGKPEQAERMRKVPVREGDLVIVERAENEPPTHLDEWDNWLDSFKFRYPNNSACTIPYGTSISTLRVNPGDVIVVTMPRLPRTLKEAIKGLQGGTTLTPEEMQQLQEIRDLFPDNQVVVKPADAEIEVREGDTQELDR